MDIDDMHEETFKSANRVHFVTANAQMAQAFLNDACATAVIKMGNVEINKERQHMYKGDRVQEGRARKDWGRE